MNIIALLALSLLPTRAAASTISPHLLLDTTCLKIDTSLKLEHPENGTLKLSRTKLLEKRLESKCPGTPPTYTAKPAPVPPKPKTEAELKAEAEQREANRVKKCKELSASLAIKKMNLLRMQDLGMWKTFKCAGEPPKP